MGFQVYKRTDLDEPSSLRAVRTLTVCRGCCGGYVGLQRVLGRAWNTVLVRVLWFAYLPTILVCWLSDAFGTRFSYLWQTKGHTLIQC